MAKSKNENCKLRHNTFEKDLSIIHIMLGAAKECLRCIAPFFGEGDYSAILFCIEIACNSMRKPRGVFGKDMWLSFVGLYLNLDK